MVATAVVACGEDGPREDEAAVCDVLQTIVDHLEEGAGTQAIVEFARLRVVVDETTNEILATGGNRFLNTTGRQVSNDEVTVDEALAIGRQTLVQGAEALGVMVDECSRVGAEVDLPEYDREGNRLPSEG
jgi:hypothetical protein